MRHRPPQVLEADHREPWAAQRRTAGHITPGHGRASGGGGTSAPSHHEGIAFPQEVKIRLSHQHGAREQA